MNIVFNHCPDLIVRTDWSYSGNPDHKGIAGCECKALKEGRPCPRSGRCIEAREDDTWTRVSRKSFGK